MLYNLYDKLRTWFDDIGVGFVLQVLDHVVFRSLAAALIAFGVVVLAGKPVIRWLASKKIGDQAQFDVEALEKALASKKHTPTMGGALIAGAIALATLLLADMTNFYAQMAVVSLVWLAVVGGFDDWLKLTSAGRPGGSRQGLRPWEKLVFQLGIGCLLGWFIYNKGDSSAPLDLAHALTLPFQRTYEPATHAPAQGLLYLSRPVFMVWCAIMMTGMSNAVNITDGMDGLASGISAAVALGLLALCLLAGSQAAAQYMLVPFVPGAGELAVVAGAMVGATLGFLWWNCAPASVFMGDTGSLCLGGLLAYIAVVIRQECLLILMGGIFLLEIGSVVLQVACFKVTKGKRVFRCAPYHWHLHLGGLGEQKIVARLWIVSVILLVAALTSLKLR